MDKHRGYRVYGLGDLVWSERVGVTIAPPTETQELRLRGSGGHPHRHPCENNLPQWLVDSASTAIEGNANLHLQEVTPCQL
jgi:hypothetical protein